MNLVQLLVQGVCMGCVGGVQGVFRECSGGDEGVLRGYVGGVHRGCA